MVSRSFRFILPLNREDLRRSSSNSQFTVQEIYSLGDLPVKIKDCQQIFKARGPDFILEEFDTFYSIICHFEKTGKELKLASWKMILKAVAGLNNELGLLFDDSGNVESEARKKYYNLVTMLAYILCQFLEAFETEATKPASEFVVPSGKGRKKKAIRGVDEGWDWEMEKEQGINHLYNLCQHPLQKLCQPPVIEEDFINLLRNCIFKLFENPSIAKNKTLSESLVNFLGSLLKRHGHSLGYSLKIIQHLQNFEHLSSPLAAAVEQFTVEHGMKNIVCEILREIGRIDSKDLSRDSAGTRTISQFLMELTERIPSIVLSSISLLLSYLNCEAYTMRNCVLSVVGEIVLKVLSLENLDDKNRLLRDKLLDKLEDHIHDMNAFVRSKTIQIWTRLCSEKVIPLIRQQSLLPLAIDRLLDKSSNVRKNSMHFLIAFLEGNPFAAKLSLRELSESYEKEKAKLNRMMPSGAENEIENASQSSEWEEIETELMKLISEMEKEDDDKPTKKYLNEEHLLSDIVRDIKNHMARKEYQDALYLIVAAKECWPDASVFESQEDDCIDLEDPLSIPGVFEAEKKIQVLKRIFLGSASVASQKERELKVEEFQKEFCLQEGQANINRLGIVNDISKQQILVKYLQDCVQFAQQLQKALPIVAQLLASKSHTDVLEAIEFFVTAYEFGVQESIVGVRKMLLHVWSKDASVKDAVVAAYKRLYLKSKTGVQRVKAPEVVNNLTHLIYGASVGELNSIEKLIGEFMISGELSSPIFQVLWERFSMSQGATKEQSHAALVLLGMAGTVETGIILSNLDLLISVGLGPRTRDEPRLAKDTCSALLKLVSSVKPSMESKEPPLRYPQDNIIFTRLSEIVINGFLTTENSFWIPLVEQAISVIYKLAEHPDAIVGGIVKLLANSYLDFSEASQAAGEGGCPSRLLMRLIHFIGQTCLSQLVHLDVDIFTEMKRRQYLQDKRKEQIKKKNRRRSALSVSLRHQDREPDLTTDADMGSEGNVIDDSEAEFITKICDTELLDGEQILGVFASLIVEVCSDPSKYSSPSLRAAATLALAKLMLVNSSFCEAQLSLLMTIMEKSAEPVIRANTIILLGDLSYRFPNLVEPWTPHLYGRLRDASVQVRKNTLSVLSHLILNDMMKVRGQISDVALCLVDKEDCISGLAKTFFHELAKKGNAVYNVLPDIISRLSDPDCGTQEDNFRTVLKYLLSFIERDRQLECLVEKLCQRFNSTRVERQNRDIAFCLSLLPFNERCLRKLQENVSCFAEKLQDEDVYQHFSGILAAAKKSTNFKPESKLMLEELEIAFEDYHEKGVTNENIGFMARKLPNPSQTPARRKTTSATPRTGRRTACKKRKAATHDLGSDSDEFQGSILASAQKAPVQKAPKRGKMPAFIFSSDSEQEKSDVENENPKMTKRNGPHHKT